jgi:hydroxymethylglutaryl-CoA reductase
MTFQEKEHFVKVTTPKLLENLRSKANPWWGKMNAQQMVEHLSDSLRNSTEKILFPLTTPADKLESSKNFLMSEKEFKPETKHPFLKEEPAPCRNSNILDAYTEFTNELTEFSTFFKNNPGRQTIHPGFGSLNYEEWIQCLHKHFLHHLKQFDLIK